MQFHCAGIWMQLFEEIVLSGNLFGSGWFCGNVWQCLRGMGTIYACWKLLKRVLYNYGTVNHSLLHPQSKTKGKYRETLSVSGPRRTSFVVILKFMLFFWASWIHGLFESLRLVSLQLDSLKGLNLRKFQPTRIWKI